MLLSFLRDFLISFFLTNSINQLFFSRKLFVITYNIRKYIFNNVE